MKIVFTTSIFLPHIGGIEKYVDSLSQYFSQNYEVAVITADITINKPQIDYGSVKIIRLPAYSIGGIIFLKKNRYKNYIIKEIKNADIVHSNDCKFLYSFLANYKKKYSYKLVISSHGFIFHTKKHLFLKQVFFKYIVSRKQSYYDKFICVSEQDENIAHKYKIFNTCKIFPGVDINKFKNLEDKSNIPFQFMYWGRIAPNKGIIECLRKLATLKIDYDAVFIGKCDDEEYMNQINVLLLDYKLKDKIHFVGTKTDDEIKEQISKSTFILMPSLHEGFGMTLAECLLSGKKIIANTNTSFKYILSEVSAEAFLFDFENSTTSLEEKVLELTSKSIIPNNVEQFSQESMFENIKKIYSNVKEESVI